jgi:hypothetical protein
MFSSNPKMKTTGGNEPRSVPVPLPAAGPSGPYDDMPPLPHRDQGPFRVGYKAEPRAKVGI